MTAGALLELAVERLASTPRLLVASDFDGTLAPLVAVPSDARILESSARALARLAACPRTVVAVVTGRDLAMLDQVCPPLPGVMRIGSYGAQWPGRETPVIPDEQAVLDRLATELAPLVAEAPGSFVERKAVSVALNVRLAEAASAASALQRADAIAARQAKLTRHVGKGVVEFSMRTGRKGDVVESLRIECGATLAVATGDDEPDLEMFDRLSVPDIRVLVASSGVEASGPGVITVHSPMELGEWLLQLADRREAATAGSDQA